MKEHSNKMIPNDSCLYQYLAWPSLEKLYPATDGNKYGDSHLNNVGRMRDLGTLNLKWMSPSTPSLRAQEEERKIVRTK